MYLRRPRPTLFTSNTVSVLSSMLGRDDDVCLLEMHEKRWQSNAASDTLLDASVQPSDYRCHLATGRLCVVSKWITRRVLQSPGQISCDITVVMYAVTSGPLRGHAAVASRRRSSCDHWLRHQDPQSKPGCDTNTTQEIDHWRANATCKTY